MRLVNKVKVLTHSGLSIVEVMAIAIQRCIQPLQSRVTPLWNYNREDDASRYRRKGPDSQAALAAALADLYKGEEEDFLRLNYREAFSMYNPIEWVSFLTGQYFFTHWDALTEYPGCFLNSHGGKLSRTLTAPPPARGSRSQWGPRIPWGSGHICRVRRWSLLSGEPWRLGGGHYGWLPRLLSLREGKCSETIFSKKSDTSTSLLILYIGPCFAGSALSEPYSREGDQEKVSIFAEGPWKTKGGRQYLSTCSTIEKVYTSLLIFGCEVGPSFESSLYHHRRGIRCTVGKVPVGRAATNPAPEIPIGTGVGNMSLRQ